MALGLEHAGFRSLVMNEAHAHPCLTLRQNFPNVPVLEGSIRDLSGLDLLEAGGLGSEAVGEIDLVAGGPPCQGFSTAGLKDPADPRNTLISDFIRMLIWLSVPSGERDGASDDAQGPAIQAVQDQLDQLGYKFHWQILFAADYGVPQMRRRLIVLGARYSVPPPYPVASHRPSELESLLTQGLPVYTTCNEALSDLPVIRQGEASSSYESQPSGWYQHKMRQGATEVLTNHQASKHRADTLEYFASVPPGGNWLDIPPHLRTAKQGIQRWPLNGLARTVTTAPRTSSIQRLIEYLRLESLHESRIF